jgi:hypothetical protein
MIKNGVRIYGIQPEMVLVDNVVQDIFRRHSIRCIRTSALDGTHGRYSLHPIGFAEDYRTRHIMGRGRMATIGMIVDDLKDALPCCDIVFEYPDEEQEHIHVEFDPKDDAEFQKAKQAYRETGKWQRR